MSPTQSVTCNSCNMGKRDFPDMYARIPRAYISCKSRVHMLQVISRVHNSLGRVSNFVIPYEKLAHKILWL